MELVLPATVPRSAVLGANPLAEWLTPMAAAAPMASASAGVQG
jgi:hypothetical protein